MATNDLAKRILTALLKPFERRQQAWGELPEGKKPRKVSLRVDKPDDSLFRNYWAEDAYKYREDYDQAADILQTKGFVTVLRDQDTGLLKEIALRIERIDEAFQYAGLMRKKTQNESDIQFVERLLESYPNESVASKYLANVLFGLKGKKRLTVFCSSRDDLEQTAKMVHAISLPKDEILLRNFSKRTFGSSKAIEKKSSKLLTIFQQFDQSRDYPDSFRDLCAIHNILLNPEIVMIKGPIVLDINGQEIDVSRLGMPFSLVSDVLTSVRIIEAPVQRVVTIENLTTFHYFKEPNTIALYTGGYPGSSFCFFVKLLCDALKNDVQWLHSGDIDWGGFNILIDLSRKTAIDFKPYHMDITDIQEHQAECEGLTDQDRRNLESLILKPEAEPYKTTILYLLQNGIKLEQESIDYD